MVEVEYKMKKMLGIVSGMVAATMVGGMVYMLMDKKKQAKVEKILSNAADEANKMMNKMTK